VIPSPSVPVNFAFDQFQVDLRAGELRRMGRKVPIQDKPLRLLAILAARPGTLITRAEIQEQLWAEDTTVDFEDGLNTAVKKLREALNDRSDKPRYIETVPKRGYRLLAPIEVIGNDSDLPEFAAPSVSDPIPIPAAHHQSLQSAPEATRSRRGLLWSVLALGLAAFALVAIWLTHRRNVIASEKARQVLVADFDNNTGDPRFGSGLQLALTTDLDQSHKVTAYPHLLLSGVLQRMERKPDETITPPVGLEICRRENIPVLVLPSILRVGQRFRITILLVDPASGKTVRSYERTVQGEDEILSAVDNITSDLRRDLGESILQVHLQHKALPQVTTASLTALEDYAEGASLWNARRFKEAAALYSKAIKEDPGFAMAHAALASAYYSFIFNDPAEGEKEFKEALALTSRTTEQEQELISIKYATSQRRIDDALQLYREYFKRYPDDLAADFSYAYMLRTSEHPQEGFEMYTSLLAKTPNDPNIYAEMAVACRQMGRISESIAYYQRAFALDPKIRFTGNISREYASTLMYNNQVAQARMELESDLFVPEARQRAEVSLAMLDLYVGRYLDAQKHLESVLPLTTGGLSIARIRYLMAVVAAGEGRKKEQIAQLDLIDASLNELNLTVTYGSILGQVYARAGALEKARAVLSAIAPRAKIDIDEQGLYLELLRAEIKAAEGNPSRAVELLPQLGSHSSSSIRTLIVEARAHFYQLAGDNQDAIVWYEQFVNDKGTLMWEPQQQIFTAYYVLANDYLKQGDRAAAGKNVDHLLGIWSDADRNLQLRRDALELQRKLAQK
jgi:DNA-binding winged helix-turn-helix (wHTH) protein/tetratricopeptide (TPR) repeat protein